MAKKICPICGKRFEPVKRQVTCTAACAGKRLQQQLTELKEKRRLEREKKRNERGSIKCSECPKRFVPHHTGHVACSPACAARRLQKAIERQTARRQQQKQEKQKQKETIVI